MNFLLGLNGELPDEAVAQQFAGVGMIRGEYLCRQAGAWIAARSAQDCMGAYLDRIAALFAPRPVWYRLIDMESNEVNQMAGCDEVIHEKTTMLGWRGVRRGLRLRESLNAELSVLAAVADVRPNLHLLLPFVSSVAEVADLSARARQQGFAGRIGMMAETPAAVLTLADMLDEGVDQVTLGMNDLSSLTIGANRNMPQCRKDHPAVSALVSHAVGVADGRGVSLCAAGYLTGQDLANLAALRVRSAVVHYSHLSRLWPERFARLGGEIDFAVVENQIRMRLHDPLVGGQA
jgi:phosphoenolpyruvate-protein kinase (PTS system EI component)